MLSLVLVHKMRAPFRPLDSVEILPPLVRLFPLWLLLRPRTQNYESVRSCNVIAAIVSSDSYDFDLDTIVQLKLGSCAKLCTRSSGGLLFVRLATDASVSAFSPRAKLSVSRT